MPDNDKCYKKDIRECERIGAITILLSRDLEEIKEKVIADILETVLHNE